MTARTFGVAMFSGLVLAAGARAQQCEYPIADLLKCKHRTPRVPHTPTVSVPPCGPDGFALGAVVPQGFGDASYEPACGGHDICYETCNSSKAACDTTFNATMEA